MTTIQLYGRLGRDPEQRTTQSGKAMMTTALVTNLGREGTELAEWFSLVAFGGAGKVLSTHAKGDMIAISGRLTKSAWTGKDGVERAGFSILVDTIASARTVKAKAAAEPRPAARPQREAASFDDAIPF